MKIQVIDNNEIITVSKPGQSGGEKDSRKSKAKTLRRYDKDQKINDNDNIKREDGDNDEIDITKPTRKVFREERRKDRLNKSQKVEQMLEKEKSTPIIDNKQKQQSVENGDKQVSTKEIYDFIL